ncbi:hypothetical protein LC048_21045 [Mesobacillus subterraneus]|uniref:hypothetical protein n=1 Tax=Mesobacillus subterraneus TaxID=285983 RepID=UPI001CFE53BD|nr:hypothetical protein [Mesobacillus subterraneus]WLR54855.1 hypothetical protein LC048_21045 [Mesobacillus subterraneus]
MKIKAIEKIQGEMNSNSNNPYIQVVGNFLLHHLDGDQGAAEKILAEDKTIAKSLEAMRRAAEKKKVGNMAVLTDAEGFAVVLKYFGIDGQPVSVEVPATPPVKTEKPSNDFNVSLDDFL